MIDPGILNILNALRDGKTTVEKACEAFQNMPYENLQHARIDHHRSIRKGLQEVVFGEGKTFKQIADIVASMRRNRQSVLVTRIDTGMALKLRRRFRTGRYNEDARCFTISAGKDTPEGKGTVLIVSAGTSDIPVAEEAYVTSAFFGNKTERLYDVGVAGIHRLFGNLDMLRNARVIIVTAGMEGALPSIVAGLVGVPVLAVPTSIGYGASFGGITALLAMLNSCSTVSVFNIDNGFGAAYFATLINRL